METTTPRRQQGTEQEARQEVTEFVYTSQEDTLTALVKLTYQLNQRITKLENLIVIMASSLNTRLKKETN